MFPTVKLNFIAIAFVIYFDKLKNNRKVFMALEENKLFKETTKAIQEVGNYKMQINSFIAKGDYDTIGEKLTELTTTAISALRNAANGLVGLDKKEQPDYKIVKDDNGNPVSPEEMMAIYDKLLVIPSIDLDALSNFDDSEEFRKAFNKCFVGRNYSEDDIALFDVWHKTLLANYIQVLVFNNILTKIRNGYKESLENATDDALIKWKKQYEIFLCDLKEIETKALNTGGKNLTTMANNISTMLTTMQENYDKLNDSIVKIDSVKNGIYEGVYNILEKRLKASFKLNIDKIIDNRKEEIAKKNSKAKPTIILLTAISIAFVFSMGWLAGSQSKEYEIKTTTKQTQQKGDKHA